MTGVSIRGVHKGYGRVAVLEDISLEVEDGEFLVLLGPSGSGKSTLLRLIAGIDTVDAGEIWLGGQRIDRLLPRFRDVAMVFQSYALYPHMTVADNLGFPLRSMAVSRAETRRRVAEVAETLQIASLLRRRPAQLSGGQQQRVALGRALIRRPSLFLMDEPLSNLDAKLRARTRLEITRLHERLRITTIYVTHDQVEAMTMGHRIGVIDAGVLHQVDRPETVYEHPADLVVADFVGSPAMNVLRARVSLHGRDLHVDGDGFALRFSTEDPRPRSIPQGGEVIAGIRAEQLRINAGLPPGQTLSMRVERVELLGHERIVHTSRGELWLAVRTGVDVGVQRGDDVQVGFVASGLRLFDPGTGASLCA